MRSPQVLDKKIDTHKQAFGEDPTLIMLNADYVKAFRFYFNTKLYQLCCGRALLYRGIPTILTTAITVEDFLVCY